MMCAGLALCATGSFRHDIILSIFWCGIICASSLASDETESLHLSGHLKPLGFHRSGGGVTVIGKFSSPATFFNEFVSQSKPIWMLNALESVEHPGLTNWTNSFLKKRYGGVDVQVEISKKEDRQKQAKVLTMRQFLNLYESEDLYMVQSLQNAMSDLVLIPPTLSCGGFQRSIQDAVLWLGSGKAASVLHYDGLDNLLCVLDGQKDVLLLNETFKEDVEAGGFNQDGGYSLADVESVDLTRFPGLANLPWKHVLMNKGDCLYIPVGWYHQVTSSTQRHLAINYWFTHLHWFNRSDCLTPTVHQNSQELLPISRFGFTSPNEVLRSKLLNKLSHEMIVTKRIFVSSLSSSTEERREQFFAAIDKYPDSVLSWSELYSFHIDRAIMYFPDIFDLPGGMQSVPKDLILFDADAAQTHAQREEDFDDDDEEDVDAEVEEEVKESSQFSVNPDVSVNSEDQYKDNEEVKEHESTSERERKGNEKDEL